MKTKTRTSFRKLLEGKKRRGKMQVIVTFLAVLELMKIGKLKVKQDETFGEIYIEAGDVPPGEDARKPKEADQAREDEG